MVSRTVLVFKKRKPYSHTSNGQNINVVCKDISVSLSRLQLSFLFLRTVSLTANLIPWMPFTTWELKELND